MSADGKIFFAYNNCEDDCTSFSKEDPRFRCSNFTIAFRVLECYRSDNASIILIKVLVDRYLYRNSTKTYNKK